MSPGEDSPRAPVPRRYHAGIEDPVQRAEVQRKWSSGFYRVICATVGEAAVEGAGAARQTVFTPFLPRQPSAWASTRATFGAEERGERRSRGLRLNLPPLFLQLRHPRLHAQVHRGVLPGERVSSIAPLYPRRSALSPICLFGRRAGRDGAPAHCTLFYSWADFQKLASMLRRSIEETHGSPQILAGAWGTSGRGSSSIMHPVASLSPPPSQTTCASSRR